MDMQAELDALRERALTLEDTIEDIDREIEKALHAVAAGTFDVGHAMTVLESRRNDHAGFMFELGKVTARIEDMENLIREQEERGWESQTVEEWQQHEPVEDHLDWLRPVLNAQDEATEQDDRHVRVRNACWWKWNARTGSRRITWIGGSGSATVYIQ